MKILHTLKTSWFVFALVVAVVIGETIAWQLSQSLGFRYSAFTIGVVSVGLTAFIVSLIYDGSD